MTSKKIRLLLLSVILISSCGGTTDPIVEETENSETSIEEVVRINNCGGKSDVKRIISKSFRASVGGELTVGGEIPSGVVSAEVLAKYGEETDSTQSIELSAPPTTNMKFNLVWRQGIRSGEYRHNGTETKYFVYIPIGVELTSANDEGCELPVDEVGAEIDEVDPVLTNCPSIEEVAVQNGWSNPELYNAIFGGYSFHLTSQSYLPEFWEADKFDNENYETLLYQIHTHNQNREMNPGFWIVYMPNECRGKFGFYKN